MWLSFWETPGVHIYRSRQFPQRTSPLSCVMKCKPDSQLAQGAVWQGLDISLLKADSLNISIVSREHTVFCDVQSCACMDGEGELKSLTNSIQAFKKFSYLQVQLQTQCFREPLVPLLMRMFCGMTRLASSRLFSSLAAQQSRERRNLSHLPQVNSVPSFNILWTIIICYHHLFFLCFLWAHTFKKEFCYFSEVSGRGKEKYVDLSFFSVCFVLFFYLLQLTGRFFNYLSFLFMEDQLPMSEEIDVLRNHLAQTPGQH